MGDLHYFILLLIQMIVVIAACRASGWLGGRYLGQIPVVMEMVTGIVLGPSIFGALAPRAQETIFPKVLEDGSRHPNMEILYWVAQLGLVLYTFLIGLGFDASILKGDRKGITYVSIAGIGFPLVLGSLAALYLFNQYSTGLFGLGVSSATAALYVGAAMCITAFPMLARILAETNLTHTRLGVLTLAAGAANDVAAWVLLSFALSVHGSNPSLAVLALAGGAGFVALMIYVVKPALARWGQNSHWVTFGGILILLLGSSLATNALGLHAVFGAFVCGCVVPKGPIADLLRSRFYSVTLSCLLPIFFCFSGLNTQIGLLDTPETWLVCGALVAVAIIGKYGGCYFAARYSGCNHADSSLIGVLMNTRGMMELIILNVGLQANVITPTFFTMMVIMAVVTTLMTSPLFKLLKSKHDIVTT